MSSPSPGQNTHGNPSTLPLEVICNVLESGDDLNDLLRLVKTSPIFLQAWRWAPRSITSQVLETSQHDYNDAKELASLQILFPRPDRGKNISRRVVTEIHLVEADVSFLTLMVGNVNAIDFARKYFVEGLPNGGYHLLSPQPKRPERPFLTVSEQRRFNHAYYRAWTFVTAARQRRTQSDSPLTAWQLHFIAITSPREIWRIREMLFYIRREFPTELRARLHIMPSAPHNISLQLFDFHIAEIRIRSAIGKPIVSKRGTSGLNPDDIEINRAKHPWDDAIFALSLSPERLSSMTLVPGQFLRIDDILPIVQTQIYHKVFYSGVFDDDQKYLELLPDASEGLAREEAMQRLCLNVKHRIMNAIPFHLTIQATALAFYEVNDMMGPECSQILNREDAAKARMRVIRRY